MRRLRIALMLTTAAALALGCTGCGSRPIAECTDSPSAANTALGSPDYCLQFDGVDDVVRIPHSPVLKFDTGAPYTLECWFSTTDRTGGDARYKVLIGTWSGSLWDAPYPYELRFWIGQDWLDGGLEHIVFEGGEPNQGFDDNYVSGPFNDGLWHHVAAVRDGTSVMRLYVDGFLRREVVPSPSRGPIWNHRPVTIGAYRDGSSPFRGLIDEVRIWNVVRTRREIRADMNRRLTGTEPGLAGLWHFDEGRGYVAHDATANDNDGGLLYAPRWVLSNRPRVP